MNTYEIGNKIKYFRKRAGLSQFELELRINDAPGTISRIENGKVNPTKETLLDIAIVLQLDLFETISLFGIDKYITA